ncbi:MAG: IS30 family transposase [Actinobacteria bacterium]|nr:IS30 family transposase [Actinomycetota bacterium]
MPHRHFTLEDRNTIQNNLEDGVSHRDIALKLDVSHTAVNKEVHNNSVVLEIATTNRVNVPRILSLDLRTRRGKGEVPDKLAAQIRYKKRLARWERGQPSYVADIAHTLYLERRKEASSYNFRLSDGDELTERIASLLLARSKDSPEQIAANLRKEGIIVSPQAIYGWIRRSSRHVELTARLRRKGKRYRYTERSNEGWNKTKDKRSIHERPAVIEKLTRYGDLEGDTIVGSDQKDRILTHNDRVTGLVSLSLVLGYDSFRVYQQTQKDICRVFGSTVHTITYDNGTEFSAWKKSETGLGTYIYFADPYRSSQRGRNENLNGLVRDYYPKGTDFKKITEEDIKEVEDILNNRSRKRYNWKSPFEQREYVLQNT